MPSMTDPHFSQTITFICTHNEDGAMGIVVNRPSEHPISSLFDQLKLEAESSSIRRSDLYIGGPVQQDRGFILHNATNQEFDSTVAVNSSVALTTSKDILGAAANNQAPEKILIAVGYAGWTAGQLEQEIGQNAWLNLEAKETESLHHIIFDSLPENRFNIAMSMMGLNLSNLSDVAGHA